MYTIDKADFTYNVGILKDSPSTCAVKSIIRLEMHCSVLQNGMYVSRLRAVDTISDFMKMNIR